MNFLLMMIIRSGVSVGATAEPGAPGRVPDGDPLFVNAANEFAAEVVAGRVPSVSAIHGRLHVGRPRAQRVRAYLAALASA